MVRRFGPAHRLGTARLVGAGAWAAAVLCASSAGAQTITVDIPPSNATQLAEALGTSTDELVRQMEAEIAALYGMLNVKEYLRLSANAQTMVSSGNAADYGSNPDGFFFGIGAGGALSVGDEDIASADFEVERDVPVGGGVMLSALLGYNLADQGLPWLTFSVHGMYLPMESGQLDGEVMNLGARVQFKLFQHSESSGFDFLHWGGLDVTTGFSWARTRLGLEDTYEAATDLSSEVRLRTAALGTFEVTQTAYTVPLELTTNFTLFEIFTLYGGAGIDIPFGDASVSADLTADLTAEYNGEDIDAGVATIRVEDSNGADDWLPRALVGVQLNIWRLRAYAQLDVSLVDTALAGSAGLRVMF